MTRIIGDESLHGRTYHLTSTTPTTVGTLCRVFEQLVFELVAERRRQRAADAAAGVDPTAASLADPEALGKMFLDQMDVYRAYWRDDPVFDAANTRAAVPDLPAPPVDEPLIRRLCSFAIDNRFRWPPAGRRQPLASARPLLEGLLGAAEWTAPQSGRLIGLAATGSGGGQWTIAIDQGQPLALHVGLPAADAPTCWLAASALAELIEGRATLEALRGRGGVSVEGSEAGRRIALDVLGSLAPARRGLVTA
jgi:hypothetical protein